MNAQIDKLSPEQDLFLLTNTYCKSENANARRLKLSTEVGLISGALILASLIFVWDLPYFVGIFIRLPILAAGLAVFFLSWSSYREQQKAWDRAPAPALMYGRVYDHLLRWHGEVGTEGLQRSRFAIITTREGRTLRFEFEWTYGGETMTLVFTPNYPYT